MPVSQNRHVFARTAATIAPEAAWDTHTKRCPQTTYDIVESHMNPLLAQWLPVLVMLIAIWIGLIYNNG